MINLTRLFTRSKAVSPYKYSSLNECINIVKSRDYENYLCSLLMNNNELKRFAIAIRSLNTELASVKDATKSKDVAQFRFQYWTETIDQLFRRDYYPPINAPVTTELKKCLDRVDLKLPALWFKRLIESRQNNLSNFPFSTVSELEIYQDQTVSSIYFLLIEFAIKLGCFKQSISRIDLDHIASHLGKSQGILNLLRGLYRNALNEECYVPNDLLIKHNCTHEDIIRLCYQIQKSVALNRPIESAELERYRFRNQLDLVFELATLSKQNLNACLNMYNQQHLTMKQTNCIFLPMYLQNRYLVELEKHEFNVFDPRPFVNRRRTLPFRLYFNSLELIRLK